MRKSTFASLALIAGLWSFTGCTQQEATTEHGHEHVSGTEANYAYICPMNCEGSASDAPGKCPVCGMDLKKNPNYVAPAVSPSADPNQTGTIGTDTSLTR